MGTADYCFRDSDYPHPEHCLGCYAARVCNACGGELPQESKAERCPAGCDTPEKEEVP